MASSKTVLLAEDEPNIAESLTFLLERAGYTVSVATDGQQALNHALSQLPDVLVLDVMLPELDGYEVAPFSNGEVIEAVNRMVFGD